MRIHRLFSRFFVSIVLMAGAANAASIDLVKYVPQDVIYCRVSDRTKGAEEAPTLRNFEQSLDDWVRAMDDFAEWRILKQEFNLLRKEIGVPDEMSTWDFFAGERMAVAVLGMGDGVGLRIPTLLLISQPADLDLAKSVLTTFLDRMNVQATPSEGSAIPEHRWIGVELLKESKAPLLRDTHEYEGTMIESLSLAPGVPGAGISFMVKDGLLFVCTNAPVLDRVLDIAADGSGHLAEDPDFQALAKTFPKKYDAFSYFSWTRVLSGLQELKKLTAFIPDEAERVRAEQAADYGFSVLTTFRASASASVWDGNIRITRKFTLRTEPRTSWQGARPFHLLKMAPRKTETVWASNLFSIQDLWKTAWNGAELLSPEENIREKILGNIQEQTGLDIEKDVVSWMGHSFGIIKLPIDLESVVPINHLAVWIETTDPEAPKALFLKIAEAIRKSSQFPVTVQTAAYEGREISRLDIPIPFLPYQPSMVTLSNRELLICTNPVVLQNLIDVYLGHETSLAENSAYKPLASFLETSANSVGFTDVALSTYASSKALERVASIGAFGGQANPNAARIADAINRVARLIRIVGVCQAKGKVTTVESNLIRSEQRKVMEDLPARVSIPPAAQPGRSLSDMEKWLPELIRDLHRKDRKEFAFLLAERMGDWFPEQAGQSTPFCGTQTAGWADRGSHSAIPCGVPEGPGKKRNRLGFPNALREGFH